MAILRCNRCGHLQEQPEGQVGETFPCPSCSNPTPIYGTLFFVAKLLEKYFDAQRTITLLKTRQDPASETPARPSIGQNPPDAIDFFNTDQLSSELQHKPIQDWFEGKQIKIQANTHSVDTTGFFDEIAVSIGQNLSVLKEVLERIRWAQQKDFSSTTISLEKKSTEDARAITVFCQQLYDYSFVSKCFHNRKENTLRLVVQTAPAIRQFFSGEWLEWHSLMACLHYAKQRGKSFSCARNLSVTLQNQEIYELDVFMLIDGKLPICIECKTGEFRQNIDKYQMLRKRLGISESNFIMCITGLSEEHAKGLSTMYGLAFTNERGLQTQLARIF